MNNHPADQISPPGGWQSPGRVRIGPLTDAETNVRNRIVSTLAVRVGRVNATNLFLMLMRNFRLFWAWLGFARKLMPYGEIDRRDTELVILRVSWNCRCRYEWGQHVDIGLRAGVSAEDIARVPQGAEAPGWEPRIQTLLQACDEFHHKRMIADATWTALETHYDTRRLLEVLMLIGQYEGLAGVLNSTGLPLDTDLEKVLAAAPIHDSR